MVREEVYSTKSASIQLCETSNSFVLLFDAGEISFKLCDLYLLKKKFLSIDMIELLDSNSPDIEIIHLPHCDRFLVLSIRDILEFRELLNGTFDILALNSEIQQMLRLSVFN